MKGNLFCPCNCGLVFKQAFRNLLESIEREVGFELYISSGPRCDRYNSIITPNRNSAHTRGEAADIATATSQERYKLIKVIYCKGIKRIGRSDKKNFIHIDIATGPVPFPKPGLSEYPQEVDWKYD